MLKSQTIEAALLSCAHRTFTKIDYVCVKLLQLRPAICDPMDCSQPGYSVHGILQARIRGWVAIS